MSTTLIKEISVGQKVKVLVPCIGTDHNDDEHRTQPGSIGIVAGVRQLPAPQGLAVTVAIRVRPDISIFSVFDETNGPIESNIERV